MNSRQKAAAAATVAALIPVCIGLQSGKDPFRKRIYQRIPFLKGNQNKYDLSCAGVNQNSPLSCRNIIFSWQFCYLWSYVTGDFICGLPLKKKQL